MRKQSYYLQLKKKNQQEMQKDVEYLIQFLCVFLLSIVITKKIHNESIIPIFNHVKYRFVKHYTNTFYSPFSPIRMIEKWLFLK